DRVADAFALQALEPGLEDRPLRAVDYDRKEGDLGLGFDQVEEADHRLLRVEEVGVHVHVQEVGAAPDLVERHLHRPPEVARLDQAAEPDRAGDVGALADDHEARIGADLERLEPGKTRPRPTPRNGSGGEGAHRARASILGTCRGGTDAIASRIWRMCSGPVPQQPPAALRYPASANSLSSLLVVGGCSS